MKSRHLAYLGDEGIKRGENKLFKPKPIFYMLVGLPASGKTHQAHLLNEKFGATIHTSDRIREELFQNENCQQDNNLVFETLHKCVIDDLRAGKNTVFDATNINYKRRIAFLNRIKKIECQKVCLFMATPFETCIQRNENRGRAVPHDVLDRMYRTVWIPGLYEGWDYIELIYPEDYTPKSVMELFNGESGLNFVEQDNPHHAFTVGHHCCVTYGLIGDASKELQEAALLHDIGKPYTKSFINSKGETTSIAHYYDHHNVSAYDSLFYSDPDCDRIYVANLIGWHMRPFLIERAPNIEKARNKFKNLIGTQLFNDVMALHAADVAAKGC